MLRIVKRLTPIFVLLAALVLAYNFSTAASLPLGERAEAGAAKALTSTTLEASEAQQSATLATWTSDSLAAAQPMPFPEDVVADQAEAMTAPLGEPGLALGGLPAVNAEAEARQEFPESWGLTAEQLDEIVMDLDLGEEQESPEGTPAIFTYWRANYYNTMWKQYPYKATGKLFFNTPGGGSYCSATVISPNNIIVTAAHCVFDTNSNTWYDDWVFHPAWRNGSSPYGSFPWTSATILNDWINAAGTVRRYDVAVIKLGNNNAGKPVTYYTGWLGRSWNYPYVQNLFATGYPSNLSSGDYTYFCSAETFDGGTDVLGMGCNMTYGSSGGAWIRKFWPHRSGSVNYVDAVVSGGTPGTNTFYGPRFSSNNIVVVCNAAGC